MALAGRPSRRGGAGIRWITVGVVVTLLVLLIDASLKSRSPKPVQQLAAGTWVDRVLPVIQSSTAEGAEVSHLWAHGLTMSASSIASTISGVASGSEADYRTVSALKPPDQLAGAAGLLEATLLARSQAASALQKVFDATLGSAVTSTDSAGSSSGSSGSGASGSGASVSSQLPAVSQAESDIEVGDRAYQLFTQTFPAASVGVRMPSSQWVAGTTTLAPYQSQAAKVFLSSLQSHASPSTLHRVQILSVSLSPAPVRKAGSRWQIPDASSISATIVVADTGNQAESNLVVEAVLMAAAGATSGTSGTTSTTIGSSTGSSSGLIPIDTAHDYVNLTAGDAHTISELGPLTTSSLQGVPAELVITVKPQSGASSPTATTTIAFEMPPPPTTTTTSTTTPENGSSSSTTSTTG